MTSLSERAAGAQTIIASAARRPRIARPAQRGRLTAFGGCDVTFGEEEQDLLF